MGGGNFCFLKCKNDKFCCIVIVILNVLWFIVGMFLIF